MAEIMACIESSLTNWSVRHLSLWNELVSPELAGMEHDAHNGSAVDIADAEEATAVALYNEVKAKLAILACSDGGVFLLVVSFSLT